MKKTRVIALSLLGLSAFAGSAHACEDFVSTLAEHKAAGRAYQQYSLYYATGSSAYLGYSATTTKTLRKENPSLNVYLVGACPAAPTSSKPTVLSTQYDAYTRNTGDTLIVTGVVNDVDGDLVGAFLNFGAAGWGCELQGTPPLLSASYTCEFPVPGVQDDYRETFMTAVDAEGNFSDGVKLGYVVGSPQCFNTTNSVHVTAGRAYPCGTYNMNACAVGSGSDLGSRWYGSSILVKTASGNWADAQIPGCQ